MRPFILAGLTLLAFAIYALSLIPGFLHAAVWFLVGFLTASFLLVGGAFLPDWFEERARLKAGREALRRKGTPA